MTRLEQWSERVTLAMLSEYWSTSNGPDGGEQRDAARAILERAARELAHSIGRESNGWTRPTLDAWLDSPAEGTK